MTIFIYTAAQSQICERLPLFAFPAAWNSAPGNKLKGHGNEADFLGFLQKLGPHRSLTPAFGFEFEEIFVIEKRLSDSLSRGVDDSPTRRVGESAFEC